MNWVLAAAGLLAVSGAFASFGLWRQRRLGVRGDGETWMRLLAAAGLTPASGEVGLHDAAGAAGGLDVHASASRCVPGQAQPPEVDISLLWPLPRWGTLPLEVRSLVGGTTDLRSALVSGDPDLDAHYRFSADDADWLEATLARPDVRGPLLALAGLAQVRLAPEELSLWIPPVASGAFRAWSSDDNPLVRALAHGGALAQALQIVPGGGGGLRDDS